MSDRAAAALTTLAAASVAADNGLRFVGADLVGALRFTSRGEADMPYVEWVVRAAEMVWIAGGDQSEDLDPWRGTALERAVRHVYAKGGVVGGTSAGAVLLGERIYDPGDLQGVTTDEALGDPFRENVILSPRFRDLPLGDGLVVDSYVVERNRLAAGDSIDLATGAGAVDPTLLTVDGAAP